MEYTIIEDGELLKWEKPGMVLEGILSSYKEQNTPNGIGHVYEVRTKNGMVPFFAPTLLHKKLKSIGVGKIVRIKHTEVQKTNAGNPLKIFQVGFAEPTRENLTSLGLAVEYEDVDEASEEE